MKPTIFGIVNITEDSFSDGGKYLSSENAIAQARALADADVLDLGAAASNVDAKAVAPDVEIARLAPVVDALRTDGRRISIDSFSSDVQRWALERGVGYLNDIQGFSDPSLYPALAACECKLVVMHSVQVHGRANKMDVAPGEIFERVRAFFETRIATLTGAGIARERLILDPGMGFFLGSQPEASLTILRQLGALKRAFALPLFVSVSRKSFLRALTGLDMVQIGAATLAAELFALRQGADYIRTHDPAALRDALKVLETLDDPGQDA